jgi:4-hydroxybenzoate polyprenyltransferase
VIKSLSRFIQWLIFTNLYIALAAACFQLVIVVLVDRMGSWNWMLTLHTFFSTWMVYQFSRWNFHRNIRDSDYKRDELYTWLDRHPNFTIYSACFAGACALLTVFFLKWQTLCILAGLGVISVLYPLQFNMGGRLYGLRSIPFTKIFQIALVWAGISVWAPLSELGFPPFEHWDRFAFHFGFILFITLPFDIVDLPNDRITNLKTIPAWLGVRNTKLLIVIIGLLLIAYEFLRMTYSGPFMAGYLAGYTALIAALASVAFTLRENGHKWLVMAIYDGAMIALFLITWILH